MAHKHSVYDTSLHFIIDGNTRLVKNSTEAKVTLVQYDHNSERITFELPRYIDGHDMSLCTNAQVHYINIERKTNRESVGVYECDDLQIAPDDENVVICSWLISKNATRFVGSLFFVIRFVCSEDREITYSWNTARHTGLSVTDGIYNGEDVDEIVESDAFKIFNETIEAANTAIENANEATKKANDSIIHIRYSKYADGTDFVEVWTPMYDYIGIATGLTAPTDPSDYQWSRFNAKGYWAGSTEEYNAIPDDEIIDDYLYIPDDDTFFEDLESGEFVVGRADKAATANGAPIQNGEVMTFTFGNENGFGINSDTAHGFFKLWAHNNIGDGSYYCNLTPSTNNRQNLGWIDKAFRAVYSKNIYTSNIEYDKDFETYADNKSLEGGSYQINVTMSNVEYSATVYFGGTEVHTMLGASVLTSHSLLELVITADGIIKVYKWDSTNSYIQTVANKITYRKLW